MRVPVSLWVTGMQPPVRAGDLRAAGRQEPPLGRETARPPLADGDPRPLPRGAARRGGGPLVRRFHGQSGPGGPSCGPCRGRRRRQSWQPRESLVELGDRTPDPQTASLMLSQLSYSPTRTRKLSAGPGAVKATDARPMRALRKLRAGPWGFVPICRRGSGSSPAAPEWRNGYTQGTQNPPAGNGRVGSNPTSGTSSLPAECSRRPRPSNRAMSAGPRSCALPAASPRLVAAALALALRRGAGRAPTIATSRAR